MYAIFLLLTIEHLFIYLFDELSGLKRDAFEKITLIENLLTLSWTEVPIV